LFAHAIAFRNEKNFVVDHRGNSSLEYLKFFRPGAGYVTHTGVGARAADLRELRR
jgi:hypothetical protein